MSRGSWSSSERAGLRRSSKGKMILGIGRRTVNKSLGVTSSNKIDIKHSQRFLKELLRRFVEKRPHSISQAFQPLLPSALARRFRSHTVQRLWELHIKKKIAIKECSFLLYRKKATHIVFHFYEIQELTAFFFCFYLLLFITIVGLLLFRVFLFFLSGFLQPCGVGFYISIIPL